MYRTASLREKETADSMKVLVAAYENEPNDSGVRAFQGQPKLRTTYSRWSRRICLSVKGGPLQEIENQEIRQN